MATHCLLVTYCCLSDLHEKKFGIFQRLATLAAAGKEFSGQLRILCLEPFEEGPTRGFDSAEAISKNIGEHWGIDCDVIVGRHTPPSALPWIIQQSLGVLRYRWQPSVRFLLDRQSVSKLQREFEANPSIIIIHRLPTMSWVQKLGLTHPNMFFDLDDVEHIAASRNITKKTTLWRDKLLTLFSLPSLLHIELRAIATANGTFVCSEIDAKRITRISPSSRVSVLPNAVTIPKHNSTVAHLPIILLVGVYSYYPNKDAADYFINSIFPLIKDKIHDAEFWVAGGNPEQLECHGKSIPGVKILGYVDDLGEIYQQARIVVCPVRQGSGTRVKLVEAAAWGKPIVTTTIGAEGLELENSIHALYADTGKHFADQCLTLLNDMTFCEELGKNARKLAEQTYDKKRIVQQLVKEIEEAVGV